MDNLKDKISKIKDDHAAEVVDRRMAEHDEQRAKAAIFMLGRIKQVGHDARAIATALSAQEIRALENFQQEALYQPLGYQTFADFLDKCEYSPMTRRQYYDRLGILEANGDEIYDLLTSVGISVRAQKLLGKGELSIKGDRLMIGDQEVEVANAGVIKDVIKEFVDEIRDREREAAKHIDRIEKLENKVDQGQRDYDELQRNFDRLQGSDPYERSLGRALLGLLELTEAIGQLPDKTKAARGRDALPVLWAALQRAKDAYGTSFSFEDHQPMTGSELDAIAAQVLSGDD